MAKRFNIRMAGVGGQGVVTGSHILSTAVIRAGGESTIVPFYGSEKRMAPVESYVRVSDEPIYEIGEITFPHICIIFHPQVITHGKSYTMPFYFGLKQNGVLLINHDGPMKLPPHETNELKERNAKLDYITPRNTAGVLKRGLRRRRPTIWPPPRLPPADPKS